MYHVKDNDLIECNIENLKRIDYFLKKYSCETSIKTISEFHGFITSVACIKNELLASNWQNYIFNSKGLVVFAWTDNDDSKKFDRICYNFYNDCINRLKKRELEYFFQNDNTLNISEWSMGFLRGSVFWGKLIQSESSRMETTVVTFIALIASSSSSDKKDLIQTVAPQFKNETNDNIPKYASDFFNFIQNADNIQNSKMSPNSKINNPSPLLDIECNPFTLKMLDAKIKKFDSPNSIKTSSELHGFLTSVACTPNAVPEDWFSELIDPHVLKITEREEQESYIKLCAHFYNDCQMALENDQLQKYFVGEHKVTDAEWCKGFLRGQYLWSHYLTNLAIEMNDPKNLLKIAKQIESQKSYNNLENQYNDKNYIKSSVIAFINIIEVIASPELTEDKKRNGFTISDKDIANIPSLTYAFRLYIAGEYNTYSKTSLPRKNNQNFEGSSPHTFQNQNTKTERNDPCPCGSGKKYKKCCGSQ